MIGQITAVTIDSSITVNVTNIGGSGTFAAWTFAVSGLQGTAGSQGITGTGSQGTQGIQGIQGTSIQGIQGASGSGGGGSSLTVADTPPTTPTPVAGNMWFESDTTKTFVYYDNYWVEQGSEITTIGNLDGGFPSSTYGGMTLIDAGTP